MRFGLLLASTVLATVVACTCAGIDDLPFACQVPADCAPGYECVDFLCQRGGADAGEDGGQDAGQDGGEDAGEDAGCIGTQENCTNGQDDDCDALADCQDLDCAGQTCAPGAKACVGGQCRCLDGGTGSGSETSCTDNTDNDCDGNVDCADLDCAGQSCGAGGRICQGGGCSCAAITDAGTGKETLCSNGADDDCDGNADCADQDCLGAACGTGCRCVTPNPYEVTCSNNVDDDGDNATDCVDVDCNGRSCGAGCVCNGGTKVETVCSDGLDNDSNQGADCADPNCTGRACGTGCVCNGTTRVETVCSDGADNDGNQGVDCADPDCLGQSCGTGCTCGLSGARHETACADGVNNDGDGATDCNDPDCPCYAYFGCVEQSCSDGTDDDFCPDGLGGVVLVPDGTVDCQDSDCNGHSCGNGCVCLNGTGAATEIICNDAADNDGDANADCPDLDCAGRTCGTGCTCAERREVEVTCNNGGDDDGDTFADCLDPDCAGQTCGSFGRVCGGGACVCSPTNGPRQATESICNDGVDNDCDGLVDCNDPNCRAILCACPETTCTDGIDNDCDGLTDCAEAYCLHRQCGAGAGIICCGTGAPSSAFCKNITNDVANCGGCGTACGAGFTCSPYGTTSGRCSCTGDPNCPLSQRCQPAGNQCQCRDNTECASGQYCSNPQCLY